jgi:stage II sporulation protein AA (anti-sigma F factor antagonist)
VTGSELHRDAGVTPVAPPELATVDVRDLDGIVVASISGEIDISNVDRVADKLNALPNAATGLVVDLSQAEYLDSSAISLLHDLALRLRQRSQKLVIASPHGSPPRRVLELAAVHVTSRILDGREQAIQALSEDAEG